MMRVSYKTAILALLTLAVIRPVLAHTDEPSEGKLTLGVFLLIIAAIAIIVGGFLYWLHTSQSRSGNLPIKKLAIAAAVTVLVNASVLGFLYVDI